MDVNKSQLQAYIDYVNHVITEDDTRITHVEVISVDDTSEQLLIHLEKKEVVQNE